MKVSDAGRTLIRGFEGLRTDAYLCPAGIPTIGYGHTKGVRLGDKCTEQQADKWLAEDLVDVEDDLARMVKVPLTQGQFDALASFDFNLGAKALAKSTLLRLLNDGDYKGAAGQFGLWIRAGGRPLRGLYDRRKAEVELFLGS